MKKKLIIVACVVMLVALFIIVFPHSPLGRKGIAPSIDGPRAAFEIPDAWLDSTSTAIEWDYWCPPPLDWKETHALSITLNAQTIFKNHVGFVGLGPHLFETTRLAPGDYLLTLRDSTRDQSVSTTFSAPQTVEIHIRVEPLWIMTCTNECPGKL